MGGSRDHCHRIDRALRRCCLTVDTADDPHLGSDVSLHRRQSRVHTGTTMLAEKSPDTHQHRRCAASSAAGLQPTLGRSPVPMLAHELARSAERPLAIAVDDGRAAPRAYPRALPRRNRTSRSKGIRPMVQTAAPAPAVTPPSSSPHEIIPSPRHRNPDGKPCTIPKPPTDSTRTSITAESVPHEHIYGPTVETSLMEPRNRRVENDVKSLARHRINAKKANIVEKMSLTALARPTRRQGGKVEEWP